MATRLIELLTKLATGRLIILFLFLVVAINVFALPAIYPRFETLDLQSSYSPDKAYQLISSYGEEGRQYYAFIELTLDVIYPLLSALLFSSLTIYFFRRVFPPESFWQKLPLLGLVVMVVDYLENSSIVVMLLNYPRRFDIVAQAANMFTIAKFALSQVELILIVIGLGSWFVKFLHARVKRSTKAVTSRKQ